MGLWPLYAFCLKVEMPHFPSPLPFWVRYAPESRAPRPPAGRAGLRACAPAPGGQAGLRPRARKARALAPGVQHGAPGAAPRRRGAWGDPPMAFPDFLQIALSAESFDRYIYLARNIGYGTIKPMTKYCPIFILSLAGVQQNRNIGLACNYGAAICEKSVQ